MKNDNFLGKILTTFESKLNDYAKKAAYDEINRNHDNVLENNYGSYEVYREHREIEDYRERLNEAFED